MQLSNGLTDYCANGIMDLMVKFRERVSSPLASKSNPPNKAEQINLNGFLPSFYWPDYVSNLVMGRRRLNIYFYHAQDGQQNIRVISVTALTSKMYFGMSVWLISSSLLGI